MSSTPYGPIGTAGTFQYQVSAIIGGRTDTRPTNIIQQAINSALNDIDTRFDHKRLMREQRFTTYNHDTTLTSGTGGDFTAHQTSDIYYVDLSTTLPTADTVIYRVTNEAGTDLTESSTRSGIADGEWFFDPNIQILYIKDETNDLANGTAGVDDPTYYVRNHYSLPIENTRRVTIQSGTPGGAATVWSDETGNVYSASSPNPPMSVCQDNGNDISMRTRVTTTSPGDGEWFWQTGTLYLGDTTNNMTTQDDRDVYTIHPTELSAKIVYNLRRQDSNEGEQLRQITNADWDLFFPFPEDEADSTPALFTAFDDYIAINPPGDSTYAMNVRYSLWSPPLVNDYDTIVYNHMDSIVVAFSAGYAYQSLQEEDSAQHWFALAEKRLKSYISKSRHSPGVYHVARGYRSGVPVRRSRYWGRLDQGWWR